MKHSIWSRWLPAALALSFVAAPAASAAEDIGQQIEREYGVVGTDTREGRRLNEQMDRVVDKIVDAVDDTYPKFKLKSAKLLGGKAEKTDKVINAFALPDGRIYVTLGLMRILEGSPTADDELAFVVGHEVTHVVEKHSANQAKKSLPVNVAAILLGAVTKNRTIGTVAGAGAAAYGASFSRKDEYSADRGGLTAMYRAGYNTEAAATMLKRLKSKGEGSGIGWFNSHPNTDARVEKVREMSADLRAGREARLDDEGEKRPRRKQREP
jgi:predicted Zn-dependent protease